MGSTNSIPFKIEISRIIPSSVQLLPAKKYNGSPIGTSYDVRAFSCCETLNERIQKNSSVKLGVKFLHKIPAESVVDYNQINPISQYSTLPRLRLKLSPKARKLIKHTSLILHGEYKNINSKKSEINQVSMSDPNFKIFTVVLSSDYACV